MHKEVLHIVKIGGNILDDVDARDEFLGQYAELESKCILVHGGGKKATSLAANLNIQTQMIDGRRITDQATLDVVVMVYAGLINKQLVAGLQARGVNTLGLCGADANLIQSSKRGAGKMDFGFVGDPQSVNANALHAMIETGWMPVIAPITHDGKGQLLNTNADTIASVLAIALNDHYDVQLTFCFEKPGVLLDANDETSVISELSMAKYNQLKDGKQVHSGMIPKLDNAFEALNKGVTHVHLIHALQLNQIKNGTKLVQ